jgi:hypothetical protein
MSTSLPRTSAKPATLRRRDFFGAVSEAVRVRLPVELASFRARSTMNLLKIQYGANYRIHYEVWVNSELGLIEVGLHFEDGPESTTRLLLYFDQYILEIKHLLGTEVELERWTKSWGHLHETHPLSPLTRELADRLGDRVARMIVVLQPILEEAYQLGLVAREPRPGTGGRFGRRAR